MAISKQTLALAIAGLVPLTWIGVSAASEADDPVLSDQVEVVVDEVPTTETTETTVTTEGDDTEETEETEEADELDATDAPVAEHPENHGKYVSEAAHTCPKGPGHGECVRAVAQSDAGKGAESDEGTDEEPLDDAPDHDESEAADDADEPDEDEAEGSATEDSGPAASPGRSAGHGKGHAKG